MGSVLDQLVARIYDAAVEPDGWPKVLEDVSDFLDAAGAKILFHDRKTGRSENISVRMHPDADRIYAQHYYKTNIFLPRIAKLPAGALIPGWELIPRDVYLRSEYYNDFLIPGDMCCPIGVVLAKDPDVWSVVTCGRPQRWGDFEPEHVERLSRIAPHVTRAANITSRLSRAQIERDSTAEALNRIGQGALIVTTGGEVLFANRAVERLLADGDGIGIEHGRLRARSSADSSRLQRLIATAAQRIEASGGVMALTRPPPRRPLSVLVAPLAMESRWTVTWHPAAILFVSDPDSVQPTAKDQLRMLYRLTPAEAAVALGIARGEGLQAVADGLGVSVTTARTHLQHVFDKTDTRRQAELVRLIAGSQLWAGEQ